MKEMSYIEQVYYNLNTAFSLNYMVLQNLARLLPTGTNMVFIREDIFGEKSSATKHYEMYYEDLAEIRSEYFRKIRDFFCEKENIEGFRKNVIYMLEDYNKYLGKNVSYNDIFSDRNIKNWEGFKQIFEDIENFEGKSSIDKLKLQYSFSHFLSIYDTYKEWLSSFEIFEVLDNDITSYGSKSLYHGITNNQDIFNLNIEDFHEYSEVLSKFLKSKKSNRRKSDPEYLISDEYSALKVIADFYNRMEDRFKYANSHLMENGSLLSKIKYKLSHMSDGNFEIENVYIHRNEILSLISAMINFPELHELADQISFKFLGKNVDFSLNSQQENT